MVKIKEIIFSIKIVQIIIKNLPLTISLLTNISNNGGHYPIHIN